LAKELKNKHLYGDRIDLLSQKTLIMLFQKTSTRTRLSYEAAMTELGGHAIYVDARSTQFSLADYCDEIQAIMRFGYCLMFRALRSADVETAASYNRIPVIDGCSEKYHPSQALADLLTMSEKSGGIERVKKIAWLGIENNVFNSLMLVATKLGIEVAIAAPEADSDSIDRELNEMAAATGLVKRTLDLAETLDGADYVHTDTWMNMEFFENGKVKLAFEQEFSRRKDLFMPYQLNASLIECYAPQAGIMHCMPCHIGYEISRDAIDHPNSVIYDQAENRLHMQKAMLVWLGRNSTNESFSGGLVG
jgi:ornithine carbamoyltransferase